MKKSFIRPLGSFPQTPAPVQNLVATPVSATEIDLTWTPIAGAQNYTLRRDGNPIYTGLTPAFQNTGLAPSTQYSYTVAAINSFGEGLKSTPPVLATTQAALQPPAQVTGLIANPVSTTEIDLSWSTAARASNYIILRNSGSVGSTPTLAFPDTGLTQATTYQYNITATNNAGNAVPSASVFATTLAAAGGPQIKFRPSAFYITFDHNTSMATALSLTKSIKAAYPGLAGIEKFSYPALWENPALVGGNAQYDGSWGTGDQTNIANLRGGRLMQRWLDECNALGITFTSHDFSAWGGVNAAGTQSATSFPSTFAPAYWNSTNYGTISPASNGLWGAIWANSYTPNGVRFGYYVRYWDSRVMALYISRAQYYGANFDSNPALKQISFFDESSIPAVPGYNEPAAMATKFGPNGLYVKGRAAFPTTQLRDYLNYVANGSDGTANMDLYFPQIMASKWSIGGPDMTNEVLATSTASPGGSSWGQFRAITADWRFLTYNAAIPNGGTPQAGVTNYFNKIHQSRIVEPEDLTFDNNVAPKVHPTDPDAPVGAVPTGQRFLGDGAMYHIVQQANRLGATDIYWMYQTFVGPNRNRFNTAHPNALDWIASCAAGGNVAVNGVTAGIALTNTSRPSTW